MRVATPLTASAGITQAHMAPSTTPQDCAACGRQGSSGARHALADGQQLCRELCEPAGGVAANPLPARLAASRRPDTVACARDGARALACQMGKLAAGQLPHVPPRAPPTAAHRPPTTQLLRSNAPQLGGYGVHTSCRTVLRSRQQGKQRMGRAAATVHLPRRFQAAGARPSPGRHSEASLQLRSCRVPQTEIAPGTSLQHLLWPIGGAERRGYGCVFGLS